MATLVSTREQVAENIIRLHEYGRGNKRERKFHHETIKNGKLFVRLLIDGLSLFAPNRFVGYVHNTLDVSRSQGRDGKLTNPHLDAILGHHMDVGDTGYAEIDAQYLSYCREFRIVPSAHQKPRRYWSLNHFNHRVSATSNKMDRPDQHLGGLRSIALQLNSLSINYEIGKLQDIRAALTGRRKQRNTIFTDQSIHEEKGYALHWGGRSELQFNIGIEELGEHKFFRFGVAFSLEPSRTFPAPLILLKSIRYFNEYLSMRPEVVEDLDMWVWRGQERGQTTAPRKIQPDEAATGNFIFVGNLCPVDKINLAEVLQTFDGLLPLYRFVLSRGSDPAAKTYRPFDFRTSRRPKKRHSNVSRAAKELQGDLRHGVIQLQLEKELIKLHGKTNVCIEVESGCGTLIDVVLKKKSGYWFYEVKTAADARGCLREAIGQLLEYTLWPGAQVAERLIVVGEPPLDKEATAFLRLLKAEFRRPIEYQQVIAPY